MTTLQRILLASAGERAEPGLLERGAMLAAASGARLEILQVVGEEHDLSKPESAALRSNLRQLTGALIARYGIGCGLQFARGELDSCVVECAELLEADLVVIGGRDQGLLRDLLPGSSFDSLLKALQRPLLVLRHHVAANWGSVLLPVDFSASSQEAVRLCRQLMPETPLYLLHAFVLPFEGRLRHSGVEAAAMLAMLDQRRAQIGQEMQRLVDSSGLANWPHVPLIRHGEPVAAILNQLEKGGHDLLVLCRQGQGPFATLLNGGVSGPLLGALKVDMLLL